MFAVLLLVAVAWAQERKDEVLKGAEAYYYNYPGYYNHPGVVRSLGYSGYPYGYY